jgi:hypothetical protein
MLHKLIGQKSPTEVAGEIFGIRAINVELIELSKTPEFRKSRTTFFT